MAEERLSFPDEPKLTLDRRITDLLSAADAVRRDQSGLHGLLAAIQSIADAPDLELACTRIVDATLRLTGARTCELLLRVDGEPERIVCAGTRPATDPQPLAAAPQVLTVPIRSHAVAFGELRLTGDGLSEAEARLVGSIAFTAASAIEHARTLEEERRARRWAAASAQLTALLLEDRSIDALHAMTDRLLELAEAQPGYIAFLAPPSDTVAVHDLERARREDEPAVLHLADTFAARVSRSGTPLTLTAEAAARLSATAPDLHVDGPVLGIPVPGAQGPMGALVLRRDRGARTFSPAEAAMAASFVEQVSVAMRIRRSLRDRDADAVPEPTRDS